MKIFNFEITIKKLPKNISNNNNDSIPEKIIPKIGEVYYIPKEKTPFHDLNNLYPQIIIDVKDGYVRYNYSTDAIFSDSVETVEKFLGMYKKYRPIN